VFKYRRFLLIQNIEGLFNIEEKIGEQRIDALKNDSKFIRARSCFATTIFEIWRGGPKLK